MHVADARAHGAAVHARVAGAGPRVARQHAERARLARAVDAQQTEALALADRCGPDTRQHFITLDVFESETRDELSRSIFENSIENRPYNMCR